MQVGDKVFLKAVNNNARGRKEVLIKEYEIVKIGRKFFEVNNNPNYKPLKFLIENKKQEMGGYVPDWELYFSEQEILDEIEFNRLFGKIESRFNVYGKVNLTLDQLRRIIKIIEE